MNRQVPEKTDMSLRDSSHIAIIGNGRVAKHMMQYFALVGQPFIQWYRKSFDAHKKCSPETNSSKLARFKYRFNHIFKQLFTSDKSSLTHCVEAATHVLLLIPDDQIETFINANSELKNKNLIHFSGSLHTDLASGCHPVMTFGPALYDLSQYEKIPFVVEQGVDFKAIFPSFNNPIHSIQAKHKDTYHAMCVMAGNFTQMLWQQVTHELDKINLPAAMMKPYLLQNTLNFINNPTTSATGPLVRGDVQTIKKHQQALNGQALEQVYQSFIDLHLNTSAKNQPQQSLQTQQLQHRKQS